MGIEADQVQDRGLNMFVKRNAVFIVFGLLLLCAAGIVTGDEVSLRKAQELCNGERFEEAALVLEKLAHQEPGSGDVHHLLGYVYYRTGRLQDARKALVKAIENGHIARDILAQIARIDQEQGNKCALLAGLRLRMLLDPDNQGWQLLYADVLSFCGIDGEAEYIYRTIADAGCSESDVYTRLGNLYLKTGRNTEAVVALETAYHLGGGSSSLAETIGSLYANLGDLRHALVWYERACQLQAQPSENLLLQRAKLLLAIDDLDDAERAATPLADSKDKAICAEAFVLLGQISMKLGNTETAVEYWEKAIEHGHTGHTIIAYLGSFYFNNGDYAKAVGFLDRVINHDKPDKALLRYLILGLIRSSKQDSAKDMLQVYIEHFGLDEDCAQLVRLCVFKTGDG